MISLDAEERSTYFRRLTDVVLDLDHVAMMQRVIPVHEKSPDRTIVQKAMQEADTGFMQALTAIPLHEILLTRIGERDIPPHILEAAHQTLDTMIDLASITCDLRSRAVERFLPERGRKNKKALQASFEFSGMFDRHIRQNLLQNGDLEKVIQPIHPPKAAEGLVAEVFIKRDGILYERSGDIGREKWQETVVPGLWINSIYEDDRKDFRPSHLYGSDSLPQM